LKGRVGVEVRIERSRFPLPSHSVLMYSGVEIDLDLVQRPSTQTSSWPPVVRTKLAEQARERVLRWSLVTTGSLARRAPWDAVLAELAGGTRAELTIPRLVQRDRVSAAIPRGEGPAEVLILTGHEAGGRVAQDAWRAGLELGTVLRASSME